jgi:hypothetical protein
MVRALRVTMTVYGAILVLFGLGLIFMPDQIAGIGGITDIPSYGKWTMAVLGATFVAACVWVIAAGRDPLQHIYWVKFVITLPFLLLVINIYSIIRGYISFSHVAACIALDVIFAVLFLVFYPWRPRR